MAARQVAFLAARGRGVHSAVVASYLALATLAGCGQPSQGEVPLEAHGAGVLRAKPAASHGSLLYVSNDIGSSGPSDVDVFTYPDGKKVSTLTGFEAPGGLCTDPNGDVYVTDIIAERIVEYAHGGSKPVKTLSDNGFDPVGCAYDPISGTLAITNISPNAGFPGNIAIYSNASGTPRYLTYGSTFNYYLCTYDSSGNLFASGLTSRYSGSSILLELPKGKSALQQVKIVNKPRDFGFYGVQWDGKNVTVGGEVVVYLLSISGKDATILSEAYYRGANFRQYFFDHKAIIGDGRHPGEVKIWIHTGHSRATIRGLNQPFGVAVSN